MPAEIKSYFSQLRNQLNLAPDASDEVVRELETHLEDRIQDLEADGMTAADATSLVLERLGRPRSLARHYQSAYTQTSWHDVATASSAFLLVSALFATHLWSYAPAVAAVAMIVVSVTILGLWQGRPAWFYPWAGLALTLLSFCGYFAFALLDGSTDALIQARFRPLEMLGFGGGILYFPLALVILASSIRAASRRDWLDASLMLSPSVPVAVWLFFLHQNGGIHDGSAALIDADSALAMTFFAMAIASAVFVRVNQRSLKMATILVSSVLVLASISSTYDAGVALSTLTARSVFLIALLVSPAVVEKVDLPSIRAH